MRLPMQIGKVHWRTRAKLEQMYRQADTPRLRMRVQMVLLALDGKTVADIAAVTRGSDDTVRYWLHRFEAYGCAGLLEGAHPGRPAMITALIEGFLRECLEQSPRRFGIPRPTWTTATLARVVARRFHVAVTDECIRQHLGQLDFVCRRPTWSVKQLAQQQPGYAQKRRDYPCIESPAAWGGRVCARRSGTESLPDPHPHVDAARPATARESPWRASTQARGSRRD